MDEIICVLDKSGSMQAVAGDAVGGFNKFVEDQRNYADANLTVIWFDDSFKVVYEGRLSEYKNISEWPNGGMTALTDAIGKTFNHVKERFTKERPKNVILAILTDGHENRSCEFSKKGVADLIKEHQDKYKWQVLFLAANQDAWATSQQYNIKLSNTFAYHSSDTKAGFDSYSSGITNLRST